MSPSRSRSRQEMPEEVAFPVTPMLDMAFQLLAFFVLTFQVPTSETRIDLYLPAAPIALPAAPAGPSRPSARRRSDLDLETDLIVRAEADELGELKTLRLGEATLPDAEALGQRLGQYAGLLGDKPLRVLLVADDALRYEPVARLIGTCASAGVASIRLADPSGRTDRPGPRVEP